MVGTLKYVFFFLNKLQCTLVANMRFPSFILERRIMQIHGDGHSINANSMAFFVSSTSTPAFGTYLTPALGALSMPPSSSATFTPFGNAGFESTSFDGQHGVGKRRCRKKNFEGKGGWHNPHERSNLHCTSCGRNGSHEANDYRFPWEKIKDKKNHKEDRGKTL
jgi:hypothetical protein